jgi:hypothetical protein
MAPDNDRLTGTGVSKARPREPSMSCSAGPARCGTGSTSIATFGDEHHYANTVAYIENNPVKAGLCPRPEDWPYSSSYGRLKPFQGRSQWGETPPLPNDQFKQ